MVKKLFIFGVIMLAISAISTFVASDKPEDREPTLEEKCAWKMIKNTIRAYPEGMAELESYTISDTKTVMGHKEITVQGTMYYSVNGESISMPFGSTCNIH